MTKQYVPPSPESLPVKVAGSVVALQLVSVETDPDNGTYMVGTKDARRAGLVVAIDEDYWYSHPEISPQARPDVGECWLVRPETVLDMMMVPSGEGSSYVVLVRAEDLVATVVAPSYVREPGMIDPWPAPASFLTAPAPLEGEETA